MSGAVLSGFTNIYQSALLHHFFNVHFTIRSIGHNREVRELVQSHRASKEACQDLKLQMPAPRTTHLLTVLFLSSRAIAASQAWLRLFILPRMLCSFPLHTSKFQLIFQGQLTTSFLQEHSAPCCSSLPLKSGSTGFQSLAFGTKLYNLRSN